MGVARVHAPVRFQVKLEVPQKATLLLFLSFPCRRIAMKKASECLECLTVTKANQGHCACIAEILTGTAEQIDA